LIVEFVLVQNVKPARGGVYYENKVHARLACRRSSNPAAALVPAACAGRAGVQSFLPAQPAKSGVVSAWNLHDTWSG
jgi:hypothetical protein